MIISCRGLWVSVSFVLRVCKLFIFGELGEREKEREREGRGVRVSFQ